MTQEELDKYIKLNEIKIKNAKTHLEIKEIISEQNQTIEEWVKNQFK